MSLITLGVRDLPRARRFYEHGLGWQPSALTNDSVAFYQAGGLIVGLFAEAELAADAGMPGAPPAPAFRGVSLAHNVPNPQLVDVLLSDAERAGGTIVAPAAEKPWGGYGGYFADPEGHLWEVAWNPGFPLLENGEVRLPK